MKLRIIPSRRDEEIKIDPTNVVVSVTRAGYCILHKEEMSSICLRDSSRIEFSKVENEVRSIWKALMEDEVRGFKTWR